MVVAIVIFCCILLFAMAIGAVCWALQELKSIDELAEQIKRDKK